MGVISFLAGLLPFVSEGRRVAEVFRPNAEAEAVRDADAARAVLDQFAAEFAAPRRGWFDGLVDGLNRLPRPLMAFGTLGLFAYAMADPVGFGERMSGLALVPEPLWWLLGAVVSFYFGARELSKVREMRAADPQRVQAVVSNIEAIRALRPEPDRSQTGAGSEPDEADGAENPAADALRAKLRAGA